MYISRIAEKQLKRSLQNNKVLIVLGARQVGKTTLLKHLLSDKASLFLNLDIEIDKTRLIAASSLSPKDTLKSFGNPEIIIIDEAQRLIDTARIVKGWFDAELPVKVILSGSSSLNLLNQSSESLTGRNEKLFLPPLVFQEILTTQDWYSELFSNSNLANRFSNQIQEILLQNIVFGSYPESFTTTDRSTFLLNLVSDYLLKDILQIGLIKNPNIIQRLLMLLAYQIGSEVSVNELANTLNVSRDTIEKYLDLLEQTFVIFRLRSFSSNPRKEISKSQKIYFWDTGIRNALLNEFSLNPLRSDIGILWENWVVAEFAKLNLLSGQKKDLYFWRSRAGGEVDLLVKEGEIIKAYEIKWRKQKINQPRLLKNYNTKVEVITSSNPFTISQAF